MTFVSRVTTIVIRTPEGRPPAEIMWFLRASKLGKGLLTVSLVLLFLVEFAAPLSSQEGSAVSRGRTIFQAKCASCHTVGGGDRVGPDLQGVTSRREAAWLDRFIREPDVVIKGKDPAALALLQKYSGLAMPNLGITGSEAVFLMAYLASSAPKKAAAPAAAVSEAQTLPEGSAAAGKLLFSGLRGFQKRGAQCFACHSVASIAPPDGGSLGPDLTGALGKYGGAKGLARVLAGMPFPTMAPVYRDHALTPQEQADLAAYLGVAGGAPASMTLFVAALALWGLSGLYVILHAVWGGRLGRVRASLQAR